MYMILVVSIGSSLLIKIIKYVYTDLAMIAI